ncbi:hypothetical protein SCP_0400730 [Sparassis crispa]|uniref:Uncharacterized protein n=1 Tax=Sparassis crispa TaxID=139825 RepID=A0A401GHQ2_9APHY|nr:hypothetical protein SCP_0400730 [Sparassis crispa]GBE81702.1 hypothetical protein SCP_0400730 [Sparassis crispa]
MSLQERFQHPAPARLTRNSLNIPMAVPLYPCNPLRHSFRATCSSQDLSGSERRRFKGCDICCSGTPCLDVSGML